MSGPFADEYWREAVTEMNQEGLINHMIIALALDVGIMNEKTTLAESKPPLKNADEDVGYG